MSTRGNLFRPFRAFLKKWPVRAAERPDENLMRNPVIP
jgi:hypothetical protein